ncbi:uncharacterized protein L969DRAFT_89472 [Mixia osmundae IAM 14324]|uniref:uncharacterized protein n=1 Tax=Mixia osmundae (strain CBS 9802 / IAM 14324 / JCM 22182 / KY 12970) TaxID=764103 RepID=UPI0004A54FBD|nr:uncharacterized protein L969DRAFT_89472 [Mixia osmundae IAM 14324]KEI37517.1 hypothetical protein L969DRAFT_89472 [Mixia osmundae IAM 14324]
MDVLKLTRVERVTLYDGLAVTSSSRTYQPSRACSLHLTEHHVILRFDEATSLPDSQELWIPHPLVAVLALHPASQDRTAPLIVRTRDFHTRTLVLPTYEQGLAVWESIRAVVAATKLKSLYAFSNGNLTEAGKDAQGWNLYSPSAEYARMGLGRKDARSAAWRWSDVNKSYEFCPTYPSQLAVPATISDSTLNYGKGYRSKQRVPALVYLHWSNLASITRSSQPMVGLKNARSIQDEKLVEAICRSHASHTLPSTAPRTENSVIYGATATNLIIDARPTTNAMANVAKGAGTENMEHYKACKKAYLGIDNIHIMRASLAAVNDALWDAETTGVLSRRALRKSGWLKHLTAILEGAVLIARNVHINNSHVLVHCSDGWDRTSQLSALAQICLDPYYRTMEGFAVLVEKDWLAFGHKFGDRAGHTVPDRTQFMLAPGDGQSAQAAFLASVQKGITFSSSHVKETSPVFHQFLDCVYQLVRQFPHRFEFGSKYLQRLHFELYSCRYGTFLFNSERERYLERSAVSTQSVWTIFRGEARGEYLNTAYEAERDTPAARLRDDQGVILPNPKEVRFWHELLNRTEDDVRIDLATDEDEGEAMEPELVGPISGSQVDPVLAPMIPIRAAVNSDVPSRTNSPRPTSYVHAAQPQLQNALESAYKFGGSAWNSIRQGYQDFAREIATPPNEATHHATDLQDLSSNPWMSEARSAPKRAPQTGLNGNLPSPVSTGLPRETVDTNRRSSSANGFNPWAV